MRIALAVLILVSPFAPARAETRPDVSFPLGLYSVYAEDLEAASRLGFNVVIGGGDSAYLRAAAAQGLRVVANTFYDGTDTGRRRILDVRDEPNLIAHVVVDEPDIYGNPPERVERWVRGLAAIDTRPVYMTVWAPRNYAAYKPLADIFCPTPYPITSAGEAPDLSAVYRSVIAAREAEPREVPVWAVVQCFAGLPYWVRPPTPAELRSMAYQAVIAGAQGVTYYAAHSGEPYPMPSGLPNWRLFEDTGLVAELRALNAEFSSLADPLLSGERPAPSRLDGPLARVFIRHGDRVYLLAANTSSRPCTLSARLPPGFLAPPRILTASGATIEATDTMIHARFAPRATAAIEFPMAPPPSGIDL